MEDRHLGTAPPNTLNATLGALSLTDFFVHPSLEASLPGTSTSTAPPPRPIKQPASTTPSIPISPHLAAHGGKLLIYEGLSDPVFSADDIVDYYRQLERDNGGQQKTASMARLFLIPGMNHCMGGPATDQFDALTALKKWVELARPTVDYGYRGPAFPGRTRPLCPYPQYTSYNGLGNPQEGKNFTCKNPE